MKTAYVYEESTLKCLFIITGAPECVGWEAAAHLEQNGTPVTFSSIGLVGSDTAEVLEV